MCGEANSKGSIIYLKNLTAFAISFRLSYNTILPLTLRKKENKAGLA